MNIKSRLEQVYLQEKKLSEKDIYMSLKEATSIVLQLAEAKWITNFWRKLTPRQEKAIRMVSQYIEHGKFPFDE